MSDSPAPSATETAAENAVAAALTKGQSQAMADMSIQRVPAQSAFDILQREREDRARRAGRRPLFRGISLGGMTA